MCCKPMVPREHQRVQPELAGTPLSFYVDVRRFVAIEAREEEPISSWDAADAWHSGAQLFHLALIPIFRGQQLTPCRSHAAPLTIASSDPKRPAAPTGAAPVSLRSMLRDLQSQDQILANESFQRSIKA